MAERVRLHKYLAHCGVASRRKAESLIAAGRVSVNGETVTEMGVQIDPAADAVRVDDAPVRPERPVHLVLHKPRGYVATVDDERDRKTVLDLVEGVDERVYPVGRLDRDSEGLIVLTNDGALAQYLTHPSCEVTKTYRVTVDGYIEDETLARLRAGERVGGRKVTPRRVRVLHRNPRLSRVEIEIGEGLNREVRRLFAAVGHEARKLIRTRIGPLELTGLPRGRVRRLTAGELRKLQAGMAAAGFDAPDDDGADGPARSGRQARSGERKGGSTPHKAASGRKPPAARNGTKRGGKRSGPSAKKTAGAKRSGGGSTDSRKKRSGGGPSPSGRKGTGDRSGRGAKKKHSANRKPPGRGKGPPRGKK